MLQNHQQAVLLIVIVGFGVAAMKIGSFPNR